MLMSPMLELLRRRRPGARLLLLVYNPLVCSLWQGCPYLDEVVALTGRSLLKMARVLWELRKRRFEISITAFPANDYKFNLLAWLIGAKLRISHRYPAKRWRSLSFLQNSKVPLDLSSHDVQQNIRLLRALGIEPGSDKPRLKLWLQEQERRQAREFLRGAGLESHLLVGIHPGSSRLHRMKYKRWGADKFARLAREIAGEYGAKILLLGGEDEEPLKRCVVDALAPGEGVVVPKLPLKVTAALIGACSLFVSNDSGLMHVAASMGVPTVAVFGPTDEKRTAPWGERHRVVAKNLACRPCWPLKEVGRRKGCQYPARVCLSELSAQEVFRVIRQMDISWKRVDGKSPWVA